MKCAGSVKAVVSLLALAVCAVGVTGVDVEGVSSKRTISSTQKTANARERLPTRCVRRSSLRFEFDSREVGTATETVCGRGLVGWYIDVGRVVSRDCMME